MPYELPLHCIMKYISILKRILSALLLAGAVASNAKAPQLAPSYAWTILPPLGLHEPATIDTLFCNYAQQSVPSEVSMAYATTGNLGGEGMNMLFFDRKPMSDFFFRDALDAWLPMRGNHKYYNTRQPMTLLSYNGAGGKQDSQDRLKAIFSGNAGPKFQFGAELDYLYSKGSYENQAVKDMMWGVSTSYIGDRYELQAFFNHYNNLNKENGGITDDLYIIDPAVLQGGSASITPKSIPTRLSGAHNRIKGEEIYVNNRYKVGYWHVTPPNDTIPEDTVEHRTYIPVSSFIWTINYNSSRHVFDNTNSEEASDFWNNFYFDAQHTHDVTSYWSLKNTVGVSLLEGFHKYAKAGLAAYLMHEVRRYNLEVEPTLLEADKRPEYLTVLPANMPVVGGTTENLLWVGAQLTKQQGKLLRYEATGKIGVVGAAAGEIHVSGNISARFKLWRDSVKITGYGSFFNETAPFLMNNYVSNHFIWHNDFGKIRRFRVGGRIDVPFSKTKLDVGVENLQNYIYFNSTGLPQQYGGSVQVLSASVNQDFSVGILNWNNRITYQTSSDHSVIPLPKLSIYSNLYILFKIAKVLHVQFGVDCDYYTKYNAPAYQPATMAFCNQDNVKVGGYPFVNAYINMKLRKARFYVMMSHLNQGMFGGNNYFSMPGYPLNPRRFQIGISVDFAN